MSEFRRRFLQFLMVLIGIAFLAIYPMQNLWPEGWAWPPEPGPYALMLIAVLGTLGVFLIWAARRPEEHVSLLWFTFWSSLVHALFMTVMAIRDPNVDLLYHMLGDTGPLWIAAILLGWLIPRQRAA